MENDLYDMEHLIDVNNEGLIKELKNKKMDLKVFLEERVKGALIRARIMSIKETDAPTYIFNLERKVAQEKVLHCLRRDNGTLTSNPLEIRKMARDFYTDLFGPTDCVSGSMDQLLQGLPKLNDMDKEELEQMISFNELSEAVQQLSTSRAPGIDGLPAEFYKNFWSILGRDFHEVVCECFV